MPSPLLTAVQAAIGREILRVSHSYSQREAILYALGIGAGADPLAPAELKFVYEGSADFQVLPTFAATFAPELVQLFTSGEIAGIRYDPMMMVQGEIALDLHKPLPRSAQVESVARIAQILDKGSGLLMVVEIDSRDESGELLSLSRSSVFVRGLGGFGGQRGAPSTFALPNRAPDQVHEEATSPRQALLYRLSGDMNPLHIDPAMAARGAYPRPILHGLCTYGFASRAILQHYCANDAGRLLAIEARCAYHVFPGETLVTEMWRLDDGELRFQTRVMPRDEVVLSQGRARISG